MNGSFLNGVSGVRTHEFGIDSWSNNISNINTNGYRANIPEFKTMFATNMDTLNSSSPISNDMDYGVTKSSNAIDTRTGSIISSSGKFDMAIAGDGWFAVSNRDGSKMYYTRNGEFNRDNEGYLVNSEGMYLLGVDQGMIDNKVYNLNAKPNDLKTQDVTSLKPIKIEEDIYIKPSQTTFINNAINLNSGENIKSLDEAFLPSLYYNKKEKLLKSDLNKFFAGIKVGDDFKVNVPVDPTKNFSLKYGVDFTTIEELQNKLSPLGVVSLNVDSRRLVFKNVTDDVIQYSGKLSDALGLREDEKNKRLTNSSYMYLKRFFANDVNTIYNENYESLNIKDGDSITMTVNNKSSTFTYKSFPKFPNEFNTVQELVDLIKNNTGLNLYVKNCRIIMQNNDSNAKKVFFSSLNDKLVEKLGLPEEVIVKPYGGEIQSSALKVPTYKSTSEVFNESGTKYLIKTDYVLQHLRSPYDKTESWLTTSAVFDLANDQIISEDHTEGKILFGDLNEPPKLYKLDDTTYTKTDAFKINFAENGDIKFNPSGIDDKLFSTTAHYMDSNVKKTQKNGNLEGFNQNTIIDINGEIRLNFSNSMTETIGRVGLVKFINEQGLRKVGGNLFETFSTSVNGGIKDPTAGAPRVAWDKITGTLKGAKILQQKLETSNVDMSTALTQLIVMQRGYSANSKTITTSDEIMREAINLKK